MRLALAALALAAFPVQAFAQDADQPPTEEAVQPAVTQDAEDNDDERICRNIRPEMGSRRTQKVCLTKEEWREFNRGD